MLTVTVGFCGFFISNQPLFSSWHNTCLIVIKTITIVLTIKNIGLGNFDVRRLRFLVDTTLVAGNEHYASPFLRLYQAHLSFHAH